MGKCNCGMRWPGTASHCSACHETFSSPSAFDKHRTGQGKDRRCMACYEMTEAGMVLDTVRGIWRGSEMPEGGFWGGK